VLKRDPFLKHTFYKPVLLLIFWDHIGCSSFKILSVYSKIFGDLMYFHLLAFKDLGQVVCSIGIFGASEDITAFTCGVSCGVIEIPLIVKQLLTHIYRCLKS